MRNVVRAIIIRGDSLLTIKRVKGGETYWVFPGGGVENGENHVEALKRECKEELGLDVEVLELMFEYTFANTKFGEQEEYFYRCEILSGDLGTGDGPEYTQPSIETGSYEPMWMKLNEMKNLDVRPSEVKEKLEKYADEIKNN
ncbi:MAG: MutT/NUDIX family phosphohydrolase [uncultured bacterium]|nr:MAG: MutT/NUDIX family phosphohydrolase [uncultured bacterium]